MIFGVVDSIMFPGTLVFSRFDYPSCLPQTLQARMGDIAARLMEGIGFDNGLFNIEMMYDDAADRIAVIEINPRMASQFADLYEKVDGTSSYTVLLDIAQGRAPHFTRRQGRYGFASSFVLRSFEDLHRRRSADRSRSRAARLPLSRHAGWSCMARSAASSPPNCRTAGAIATASSISAGENLTDVVAQFEACRHGSASASADRPGARGAIARYRA